MKKKLVFVGNKPPMRDGLGKEIDSFDYVMRINRMKYLGYAGNRIDGLCLEANDQFKYLYKGGENKEYIKKAGQIFINNLLNEDNNLLKSIIKKICKIINRYSVLYRVSIH